MVINGKPTALRFRSTNVFRKEGAGWRLVHHHTDQAAPMAAPMAAPSGSPAKP
jgi:ketosteroid isomerase-like protein